MGVSWVLHRSFTAIVESWVLSKVGHKTKLTWNTTPSVILLVSLEGKELENFLEQKIRGRRYISNSEMEAMCLAGNQFEMDFYTPWERCLLGIYRKNIRIEAWSPPHQEVF